MAPAPDCECPKAQCCNLDRGSTLPMDGTHYCGELRHTAPVRPLEGVELRGILAVGARSRR
ncbi:hypothetical protein M404DRAFT_995796 [Pisolithus tinctorius Marx 270]|uniref:Uncharacterized protein n=1 Tax=Pisolithus tinctorius Marx 270 TaxID=870435 RepID=A0A0C3PQ24_PISTI|nr:hypothetical protein M404DRAFT_995796 [Pisolithus tinctorius Marx 270]